MSQHHLSVVLDDETVGHLHLERQLLKDQAADLLRTRIINGSIPPGTRLAEREVAQLLGISRAPARDALCQLEQEGLLVSKGNTRYVTELSEDDIRKRHTVRLALEKLAAELAARNTCAENRAALLARLNEMEQAVAQGDARACVIADIETHRLIWQQADNPCLLQVVESIVGPLFGFIASSAPSHDWDRALQLHRETVAAINSGDPEAAAASIERHLQSGLQSTMNAFRQSAVAAREDR